jgi:hypothetical protein
MRVVKDWIVVNLAYKPYDMVQDWFLDSANVEWLGLVTVTLAFVFLLNKTTRIGYWIGVKEEK